MYILLLNNVCCAGPRMWHQVGTYSGAKWEGGGLYILIYWQESNEGTFEFNIIFTCERESSCSGMYLHIIISHHLLYVHMILYYLHHQLLSISVPNGFKTMRELKVTTTETSETEKINFARSLISFLYFNTHSLDEIGLKRTQI